MIVIRIIVVIWMKCVLPMKASNVQLGGDDATSVFGGSGFELSTNDAKIEAAVKICRMTEDDTILVKAVFRRPA